MEENIGLAHLCARRFLGRGMEYDDLFQAGCVGLLKAVENFDTSRGVKFSTYAVPVILGEIRRLFRDGGALQASPGRLRRTSSRKAARERGGHSSARNRGRAPAWPELAQRAGCARGEGRPGAGGGPAPMSLTDGGREGGRFGHPRGGPRGEDDRAPDLAANRSWPHLGGAGPEAHRAAATSRVRPSPKPPAELGMTQVQVSRRE